LVEDNHPSAMVLDVMLRESGREVLGPVASVSEALVLVQTRRPDMALLDVHLAGARSGIELARKLLEGWSIPALLMSASNGDADTARGVAMGFLEKPFGIDTLIASLEALERMLAGETCQVPPKLRLFRTAQCDVSGAMRRSGAAQSALRFRP
jgi:DNA-binding response OmpR family regulator